MLFFPFRFYFSPDCVESDRHWLGFTRLPVLVGRSFRLSSRLTLLEQGWFFGCMKGLIVETFLTMELRPRWISSDASVCV